MQYSIAHIPYKKIFELGQIFEDFGCLSTNAICGKNMAFHTIQRKTLHNSLRVKCLQRCSCVDARYSEIKERCVQILPNMDFKSINSTISQVNIS